MPNDDLAHDLEDLNLAATRVQQRLSRMRSDIAALVGTELRELLIEHAEVADRKAAHREKWRDVDYETSAEQRAEWSALCDLLWTHEQKLLTFARAVRDAQQLPLPTPAPVEFRSVDVFDNTRYPESRL